MKSIVEEASSVSKAIEKGWVAAGKPQEFSIKVFEVEQRNFLGLTTKSAKIAIFYNEKSSEKTSSHQTYEKRTPAKREPRPTPRRERETSTSYHAEQSEPSKVVDRSKNVPVKQQEKRERPAQNTQAWSDEMVQFCQGWLKQTLTLMNLGHHQVTVDTKNYYLKINFDQPLLQDSEREKLLFRSFAHLLMQALRNKFKKSLRGFKVILHSGR